MEPINDRDLVALRDALIVWSGWNMSSYPRRDESRVIDVYGSQDSICILLKIKELESDFYKSNARFLASDTEEMGRIAKAHFDDMHPELRGSISEIFAWCYTYDYK